MMISRFDTIKITRRAVFIALSVWFPIFSQAGERVEKKASGSVCFTNVSNTASGIRSSRKTSSSSTKKTITKGKSKQIRIAPQKKMLYWDYIKGAAEKYDLDPDLIVAIIRVESNFNKSAKSHKGAMGLMQLIPETAKLMGVKKVYDPKENIYGGARYLRQMLNKFSDLKLALAAYNAGPRAVEKYGGIPPYRETQNYVAVIMQLYKGRYTPSDHYFVKSKKGRLTFTNLGGS
ncbi:MAG: hypothetical protein B6244_06600 [Candidatus Cloacimonetes bacterium 4572_55]|nr:MAG: hypothetical protein B6244_06600 [Candidatus Cloacimonetes bacterium 4572_55]